MKTLALLFVNLWLISIWLLAMNTITNEVSGTAGFFLALLWTLPIGGYFMSFISSRNTTTEKTKGE